MLQKQIAELPIYLPKMGGIRPRLLAISYTRNKN